VQVGQRARPAAVRAQRHRLAVERLVFGDCPADDFLPQPFEVDGGAASARARHAAAFGVVAVALGDAAAADARTLKRTSAVGGRLTVAG
jgi:hypothetical protein